MRLHQKTSRKKKNGQQANTGAGASVEPVDEDEVDDEEYFYRVRAEIAQLDTMSSEVRLLAGTPC